MNSTLHTMTALRHYSAEPDNTVIGWGANEVAIICHGGGGLRPPSPPPPPPRSRHCSIQCSTNLYVDGVPQQQFFVSALSSTASTNFVDSFPLTRFKGGCVLDARKVDNVISQLN